MAEDGRLKPMSTRKGPGDAMSSAAEPKDRQERLLTADEVQQVASLFQIEPIIGTEEYRDKGNINFHTYSIHCTQGHEYLLQSINSEVFKKPLRVMEAMTAWITAQKVSLDKSRPAAAERWEPVSLVPSKDQQAYSLYQRGESHMVWRLMHRISDVVCYKSLNQVQNGKGLAAAEEMGRGLALTSDFANEMPVDGLATSLPGYRDAAGYYRQFHSVLAGRQSLEEVRGLPEDPEVLESTQHLYTLAIDPEEARLRREDPELAPYIEMALAHEDKALCLQKGIQSGDLRQVAIHGDTKIENFLFCSKSGKVRSLVDLDTIMPYTWLADWGDMVRSLINVAGEKEKDTEKIQVNREVYEAVSRGFLGTVQGATATELELMVPAVQAITLELGVRFLTDYLRGDNYFSLSPPLDAPDLNKVRAICQLTLFKRLLESADWAHAMMKGQPEMI